MQGAPAVYCAGLQNLPPLSQQPASESATQREISSSDLSIQKLEQKLSTPASTCNQYLAQY